MYRVLIVDDEPAVHDGMKLIVKWEDFGFHVPSCAFSCEEALHKLENDKYHLVIIDIRMPGMNGLELLKIIKEKSPDIMILILSGYEEFSYVKGAMRLGAKDYLLKPVDRFELTRCLTKIKMKLDDDHNVKLNVVRNKSIERNRFFNDLVCGALTENEIAQNDFEYDIVKGCSGYCVALCEIEEYYRKLLENIEKAKSWRAVIKNLIEEVLIKKKIGCVYDDTDGLLGMVFFAEGKELLQSDIQLCINNIVNIVESGVNTKIAIGYGSIVKSIMELKTSRNEALHALDRRFITNGVSVIPYDKVKVPANIHILQNLEWDLQPVMDAILGNETEKARQQIGKLTQEIESKSGSLSDMLFNIVFNICEFIRKNGGTPDYLFKYSDIISMINNHFTREKLDDWLFSIFTQAAEYMHALVGNKKSSKLVNQIKRYLDNNYMKNPSIKEIAQMFYVNPAYLGQLFKKTVGESVCDYVNRLKIAKVKKMMDSGDTLVSDAIISVGYSDSSYFYKKFKQYEGMSFAEYNRQRVK